MATHPTETPTTGNKDENYLEKSIPYSIILPKEMHLRLLHLQVRVLPIPETSISTCFSYISCVSLPCPPEDQRSAPALPVFGQQDEDIFNFLDKIIEERETSGVAFSFATRSIPHPHACCQRDIS